METLSVLETRLSTRWDYHDDDNHNIDFDDFDDFGDFDVFDYFGGFGDDNRDNTKRSHSLISKLSAISYHVLLFDCRVYFFVQKVCPASGAASGANNLRLQNLGWAICIRSD